YHGLEASCDRHISSLIHSNGVRAVSTGSEALRPHIGTRGGVFRQEPVGADASLAGKSHAAKVHRLLKGAGHHHAAGSIHGHRVAAITRPPPSQILCPLIGPGGRILRDESVLPSVAGQHPTTKLDRAPGPPARPHVAARVGRNGVDSIRPGTAYDLGPQVL